MNVSSPSSPIWRRIRATLLILIALVIVLGTGLYLLLPKPPSVKDRRLILAAHAPLAEAYRDVIVTIEQAVISLGDRSPQAAAPSRFEIEWFGAAFETLQHLPELKSLTLSRIDGSYLSLQKDSSPQGQLVALWRESAGRVTQTKWSEAGASGLSFHSPVAADYTDALAKRIREEAAFWMRDSWIGAAGQSPGEISTVFFVPEFDSKSNLKTVLGAVLDPRFFVNILARYQVVANAEHLVAEADMVLAARTAGRLRPSDTDQRLGIDDLDSPSRLMFEIQSHNSDHDFSKPLIAIADWNSRAYILAIESIDLTPFSLTVVTALEKE